MEIKQLRYFIEVAKREHISETALELNIAQSAISRQITLLRQNLMCLYLKSKDAILRSLLKGNYYLMKLCALLNI
ncbi:LysR family transcriptional regulator [Staphylococcus aureus]